MATHRSISAIFLAFFFLISLFVSSHGGAGIAVYWGQNTFEGTLTKACSTSVYNYVNIAFLQTFGDGQILVLNLTGHCDPTSDGCKVISKDISACQNQGIKVLLSLGGQWGSYGLSSPEDARQLAAYLWDTYLGGISSSRPLGDAVLDGIDFAIQRLATNLYWDVLAETLKEYSSRLLVTAAPQCPYPDYYLSSAINKGVFDYIWVQFYNHPQCEYADGKAQKLLKSWDTWAKSNATLVFMGLPASPQAACSGFIPCEKFIHEVLPIIQTYPKFGGIMLWSRYHDVNSGYSTAIKPYLNNHLLKMAFE